MSNDKMREAFEHWVRTDKRFKFDDVSLDRCEDGFYLECRAEEMFVSWQAALSQQPESEPVAWAAFGVSGHIRIWTANETKAHKLAEAVGQDLLPLYLSSTVKNPLTVPSPQPSAQVPDDWKLVPKSATREIEDAIGRSRNLKASEIWEGAVHAAPSIAEEREPDSSDRLHQNLYEKANQLITKAGADGEICSKEKEFEQLYNAVLEIEDADLDRPAPPAGGE